MRRLELCGTAMVLALGACGDDEQAQSDAAGAADSSSSEASDSTASAGSEDTAGETADGETTAAEEIGMFESGLILPPNSLACVPVSTGEPQMECNHHGSTIVELATGEVAAVWYHGEFEKSVDSRIVWSTITPGDAEWSVPEVLYDDPELSEGNPAVWVTEEGEILVFFVSIYGDGWPETKVRLVRSTDDGATFSEPQILRDDFCWNTRQKPLRLADGDLMLPLYIECLALPMFMTSSDNFTDDVRWTEYGDLPNKEQYLSEHVGQIQPALALRDDGTLSAVTRNGLGTGRIKEMIGDATGTEWTVSADIDLPNSGTSIDQVRLDNGHRVVIFNNSPEVRFPLAAALSTDDGKTYSAVRNIVDEGCDDDGDCEFHYPSVTTASDGTIWVSYTHDRTTIGWVHFDEAWLSQGGDDLVLP